MASGTEPRPTLVNNCVLYGFDSGTTTLTVTCDSAWRLFALFLYNYGIIVRGSGNDAPIVTTMYGSKPSEVTVTKSGDNFIVSGINQYAMKIVIGSYGVIDIQAS